MSKNMQDNAKHPTINAIISPIGSMNVLSKAEVNCLQDSSTSGLYKVFRQCSLAVLNCDESTDNPQALLDAYADFDIQIIQQHRGLKLQLSAAPTSAFVDGVIIKGVRQHLFAVVRDILYLAHELLSEEATYSNDSSATTDLVFQLLRNAHAFAPKQTPNVVVCWGGHSIGRSEYGYTKRVGYQLGLRGMDICTGCGPGAMKGPMKGATLGHAKQRIGGSRFMGLTEPGIIAAESPNPIVNQLIIMPDIEKRLEAFVRMGHAIIVFPGGPGTCEEILYLLGILLHPRNKNIPFPLIFTGPKESSEYFATIDHFIASTLGSEAQQRYKIIIDDPTLVAQEVRQGLDTVTNFRRTTDDAYYYNWQLNISEEFQQPFEPSHENIADLELNSELPSYLLAANLRRCMSAIVAGNVKEEGIKAIVAHGPFQISGEKDLILQIDKLLRGFVQQGRMKLPGSVYTPCYEISIKEEA